MSKQFDVVVVGAGVLGLAHAFHLGRRGLRVLVCERHRRAQGASVRNFGMIWPIGQPTGRPYDLAVRSRDLWLEVLQSSRLWHDTCGSLHLAYHDDEAQVLREFQASCLQSGRPCEILSALQIIQRFPAVVSDGLRCGLWSAGEITVDPRQIIAELPHWLNERWGVEFAFETQALHFDGSTLTTTAGDLSAPRLVVCTGADFRELAPLAFAEAGLVPCKLQMMRSQPFGDTFRIGSMLAAGLTLRHYKSFAECPTLSAVCARLDADMPVFGQFGIHVMASQNRLGEVILGDSHEYGDAIEPFDKPQIDGLVLAYLQRFLRIPGLEIAARWHGVYVKHPSQPYLIARPGSRMIAVTGLGGAGMTMSFGLAEQVVNEFLEAT